jgi:hypothetical protein
MGQDTMEYKGEESIGKCSLEGYHLELDGVAKKISYKDGIKVLEDIELTGASLVKNDKEYREPYCREEAKCHWELSKDVADEEVWRTGCDSFIYLNSDPTSNRFYWCPFCGKVIKV